ncbi:MULTISPECIES: transposase, partial [unclassified Pseudomonas]|uniref:transposase n=1 Tax=unclassified Pseudomonas TaxID=196821 RepID=UPI0021C62FE6
MKFANARELRHSQRLAAHPRYQVHFTPTSASWLNMVERFFSTLSEKWIKRQA